MTTTNPKTPSLRERIYAIVIQAEVDGLGNKLVSKVLLAVKEAMPDEKDMLCEFDSRMAIPESDKCERRGWNACIEEMERKLAE